MDRNNEDWRMSTEDRVAQAGWLEELGTNIAQNLSWDGATAEELVEYALSDEGQAAWNIELPKWWSAHDERYLIEWVASFL